MTGRALVVRGNGLQLPHLGGNALAWDFPTDLPEVAWIIIANAGGGDWTKETPEWQEAAIRWRDAYHEWLDGGKAKQS
jgi:hypothetical protein